MDFLLSCIGTDGTGVHKVRLGYITTGGSNVCVNDRVQAEASRTMGAAYRSNDNSDPANIFAHGTKTPTHQQPPPTKITVKGKSGTAFSVPALQEMSKPESRNPTLNLNDRSKLYQTQLPTSTR